jgi:hypothetical protein
MNVNHLPGGLGIVLSPFRMNMCVNGSILFGGLRMALIRLSDLFEQEHDEEDISGVTTTANIPVFPVPIGVELRRPWPSMSGMSKKRSPLSMTYAEYLAWIKSIRDRIKRKKLEKPIWPSLLK